MGKGREIRCYNYVNRPYEEVRKALESQSSSLFQQATMSAADKAESVAAELRVNVAGIQVGKEISIQIKLEEAAATEGQAPKKTTLDVEWKAKDSPRLFPVMKAKLSAYPLTATETQLDFCGTYEAPLGPLGSAIDAVLGHRIAELAIHRFIADVSRHLRESTS